MRLPQRSFAMRLVQNFCQQPEPDDMASCVLKLLAENRLTEAIPLACQCSQVAKGDGFFEAQMLAAATLLKAGDYGNCLDYWDKIIRSAPHKLEYLEKAVITAWALADKCGDAAKKAAEWLKLLENVYTSTPQFNFLIEAKAKGWQGNGSVGIQNGKLKGWLLLDQDEKPAIKIDGPHKVEFAFSMKPVAGNNDKILYEIDQELPSKNCAISLADGKGQKIHGSPIAVSYAGSVKSIKKDARPAIIIPVYGDKTATLACIGSVLASLKRNKTRPIIIAAWDCGPDAELLESLRKLAKRGKIRLLENKINLGFLATVNSAISQCGGEVILLNSDTLVHGDWIDRLLAAGENPDAATVTALGNEAELMSYPAPTDRGKIAKLSQVAIYDDAARKLGLEAIMEIPVGVGYCMLITRKAINRIGGLDGAYLFRGYGEEVDFCLRAKEAGLKNYGAFNLFVGHIGERSFGLAKKALAAQNNEAIFDKFPKYRRDYEIFLGKPEAKKLREKLSLELLKSIAKIESLELRPWSDRYLPPWVNDEKYKPTKRGAVLFVRPDASGALLRIWAEIDIAEIYFKLPEETDILSQAIRAMGISTIMNLEAANQRSGIMDKLGTANLAEIDDTRPHPAEATREICNVAITAPPATLVGFRKLKRIAAANPEATYYTFHIDSLWAGVPRPANIQEMPMLKDYSALGAEAFLLPDNAGSASEWGEWLASHGCPDLPICGIGQ